MLFISLKLQRLNNEESSLRRLQIDLQDNKLKELNDDTCEIAINMENKVIKTSMTPKIGSFRFKNYIFYLDFSINYPNSPPIIKTGCNTLHPNIDRRNQQFYFGLIESQNWKPIYGLTDIIQQMKHTLINVDFKCIPNEHTCLMLANKILNEYNYENEIDYDQETSNFEISKTFKVNFEIDNNEQCNFQMFNNSNPNEEQQPITINLLQTSNHRLQNNMFFMKLKN